MISVIFIISGIAYLIVKRFVGPKTNYLEELKRIKDNRYDTILFDLDGTLLDTRNLVNRSFIHTFEHFRPGYIISDEELDSFFGPSLKQTFSRYSNDPKEIDEMVKYYREFNISNHDDMVKVFPNTKEVLKKLNNKVTLEGYTLIPLKIYFVKGRAKVLIGLCKGKKNYDKRESIKDRDIKREMEKQYKWG